MTILFHQDHYNTVFKDYNTKNDTFLKMYHILKSMGIKNNSFFLALTQPELSGIDPHNLPKNLSMEETIILKKKIIYECNINIWYCLREVTRVPETGNTNGVKFRLDRANLAVTWCFLNNIDVLEIIPRQIGKTIGSIALASFLIYIIGRNFKEVLLTKSEINRVKNISDLKYIRRLYPDYMTVEDRRDSDNTKSVTYTCFNNEYQVFVSQKARIAAEGMGRGITIPVQHWDEVCYFPYFHITYPQAISSTNEAVEAAKRNNQPYGNIITTTAGETDTDEGRFVYNLMLNSLSFTENLYDIDNREELHKVVEANSKQKMIYIEYSFLQLGKTIEWFKEKTTRTGGDINIIKRDYLNIWTFGSTESAVPEKTQNVIRRSQREPSFVQKYDSFIVKWYLTDKETKFDSLLDMPMIIGSDPSEAVDRDFFTFVFVNPINMKVMATCRCNMSNLVEIGLFCVTLLYKFRKSLLIMERNSTGVAIIDIILREAPKKGINPFLSLYNEVVQEKDSEAFKDFDIYNPIVTSDMRKYFGFRLTGSQTKGRNFLYKTVFFEALGMTSDRIYDEMLIKEICGLQKKGGRIDHSVNNHDDLVVAFIYACYILLYGKNIGLYEFYRGNENRIMSDTDNDRHIDKNENPQFATIDIDGINRQIFELDKEIKSEANETKRIIKLHEMHELKTSLFGSDEKSLLISESPTRLKTIKDLSKPPEYNEEEIIKHKQNLKELLTFM